MGHSFDDLARSLAEGNLSRRRALRLFGAAIVGMMMALVPGMGSDAPCPSERKCKRKGCPEAVYLRGRNVRVPDRTRLLPGRNPSRYRHLLPGRVLLLRYTEPGRGGTLAPSVAQPSVVCATVVTITS